MTGFERAEAARAAMARAASAETDIDAARKERDQLISDLHSVNCWSYRQIASAVGLSRGMVAMICRPASLQVVRDARS